MVGAQGWVGRVVGSSDGWVGVLGSRGWVVGVVEFKGCVAL